MRLPDPHEAARLKAVVLARVAGGEAVRAISREAGMPCAATVRNWAARDVEWGAALTAARRRAAWARLYAFDEAKAERFLSALRAGARLRDLLGAPGMPSAATYRYWKATQGAFQAALAALPDRRAETLAALGRGRRRAFDRRLADRLIVALNRDGGTKRLEDILAADPELPSRPVLARWRREEPVFDRVLKAMFAGWRRRRGQAPVPAALRDAVGERIAMGESFADLGRDARMPSRQTLRRWYGRDPAFAAEVDQACEFRDWMLADRIFGEQAQRFGTAASLKDLQRETAPLSRRRARLRHRPGTAHRRRGSA